MKPVVKVVNVEKTYSRFIKPVKALRGISFDIMKGTSVGLVGPNGAGKSTLIRIMVGLLNPDKGKVYIKSKKPIGYVEEEPTFFNLPVYENLLYIAELKGISEVKVEKYIKKFELDSKRKNIPSELSHGQRKRLALLRALLYDPGILILDEPFSGLDPSISLWMRDMILSLKRKNVTLFISSHNLAYLLPIVDRVLFIRDGILIYEYFPEKEFLVKIIFEGRLPEDLDCEDVKENKAIIKTRKIEIPEIVEKLVKNGVRIYEISPVGIEEIYEKLYRGERR